MSTIRVRIDDDDVMMSKDIKLCQPFMSRGDGPYIVVGRVCKDGVTTNTMVQFNKLTGGISLYQAVADGVYPHFRYVDLHITVMRPE